MMHAALDVPLPWKPRFFLLLGGRVTVLAYAHADHHHRIFTVEPPSWWRTDPWTFWSTNEVSDPGPSA